MRRLSRIYQSQKAGAILGDFNQLQRLKKVHHFPVVAEDVDNACEPESFAALLENVYSSEAAAERPCKDFLRQVPRFMLPELQAAMQKMKLGRCADQTGLVLEMVRAAPTIFHERLLGCYNQMIDAGSVDNGWKDFSFAWCPRAGT